jgi:hypothetical protein
LVSTDVRHILTNSDPSILSYKSDGPPTAVSAHFDKTISPCNLPPASIKWDKELDNFAKRETANLWDKHFQASVETWLTNHEVEGITTLEELVQVNVHSPTAKSQRSGMHNWPYVKECLDNILSPSWAKKVVHNDQRLAVLEEMSASQGLRKLWNDHPEVDVLLCSQGVALGGYENSPIVRVFLILF